MCTVTFLPVKNRAFITSNRDESVLRKKATPPALQRHSDVTLLYPKDVQGGGSWIAARDDGNVAVLLNGAFRKHASSPPYRKSRGMIFIDIMSAALPVEAFVSTDLFNIEPFTLILYCRKNLTECRWNGERKYLKELENTRPHIWSSATLYENAVVRKRERWFADWLKRSPAPDRRELLSFHQFTGDGDARNDLRINRDGKILTVSITGIEIDNEKIIMEYIDLKENIRGSHQMNLSMPVS